MKPTTNEAEVIDWIEEQCDTAMSSTTNEILKKVKGMAPATMEGEAATISSGFKWSRSFNKVRF